jgi:asparagine synthase (glutamine-hydrolysing)
MCGFIGCVSFHGASTPRIPDTAATRIKWRGPDSYNEVVGQELGLGSARLAVIDLDPEADQPLSTDDGSWKLAFNGEIYNYRQLASGYGLSQRAHRSDSWALLELISKLGVKKACGLVRGMYALAAWEADGPCLWLARDPFGIKPLAWTKTKETVLFGSDPRSLASWRGELGQPLSLNPYALTHYLMVGYVPGDATAWTDIHRVLPGSVVEIDECGPTLHDPQPPGELSNEPLATADEVDSAIQAAIERHLVSDVEVGAFLSGGIDSSLIVALARDHTGPPVRTYSVGFDSNDVYDESPAAWRMAQSLESRHAALRIGIHDFRGLAESVAEAFPEPFADAAAMPTLALARRASEDVKVVLTGEGGDEMFGGYRRYWALPLARGRPARIAGATGLAAVAGRLGGRRVRQVADSVVGQSGEAYLRYLSQLHWSQILPASGFSTEQVVARAVERYQPMAEHLSARTLRFAELRQHLPECYLEKTDRSTMRHGLEARVPFLDLDLATVALRLADRHLTRHSRTKVILREVASRHLPSDVARAPKRGLAVPLRSWMSSKANADWILESLVDGDATQLGLFDRRGLSTTLTTLGGFDRESTAEAAYRLLMLELWCRHARADHAL